MVNVYLDDPNNNLDDLVYMAKEQNIRSIKSVNVINDDEYNEYISFINNLYEI